MWIAYIMYILYFLDQTPRLRFWFMRSSQLHQPLISELVPALCVSVSREGGEIPAALLNTHVLNLWQLTHWGTIGDTR